MEGGTQVCNAERKREAVVSSSGARDCKRLYETPRSHVCPIRWVSQHVARQAAVVAAWLCCICLCGNCLCHRHTTWHTP